jgi:hypothetical protein
MEIFATTPNTHNPYSVKTDYHLWMLLNDILHTRKRKYKHVYCGSNSENHRYFKKKLKEFGKVSGIQIKYKRIKTIIKENSPNITDMILIKRMKKRKYPSVIVKSIH